MPKRSSKNIIVDANIIFSAIINTNGKIADILINSKGQFKFIAPNFLRHEIIDKYDKIHKVSKLTHQEILENEYVLCKEIHFISEEQVPIRYWQSAFKLLADIDEKDTPYIAFAKYFNCKLWSGDKKLKNGLLKKNYTNVITT